MRDSWAPFEETLYRASAEQLKLFSELHANERFYGFTFDCNADYGEVLLCVNSEEGLRKTIHDHYSHYTEHEITRLRWNAGDWKYQGFNGYRGPLSSAWNRHWRREFKKLAGTSYEEWLHGVMADQVDEFSEHFMEAVCRTLVKMESGGEFEALLKSESFCTFVNDHDEVDETSWLRLAKVRLAMSPSFPATSLAGIRFNGEQRQLAQAYMAVCADLFDSGDSTTAWHLAAEALRLQPSLVETVKARATDEGEQPFRVDDVALPIAPKYVLASALLARTSHFVFGQGPDNRLADVDAALALVPDYEPALLERAELRHASACIDEGGGELLRQAVDDYSRILRARPNDLKVLRQRARAHVHGARRDYANALADYDRIMSLATPTAEDYSDRA